MCSARYAALSRHLALLAIARRIVLKSIGDRKRGRDDRVPCAAVNIGDRATLFRIGDYNEALILHVGRRWCLHRDLHAFSDQPNGNRSGQIETFAHRAGRRQQSVDGQVDDGVIAHTGTTAVTSTSTRMLGHTSPSMMLNMAAGSCRMISLLTAR